MNTSNPNQTVHSVKTRLQDGAPEAVETTVTIDWEGMSLEQVRELAARTIVIKWQGNRRKEGSVPSGDVSIKAVDYDLGTRAAPDPKARALNAVGKLSAEEKLALLAKLQAEMAAE